MKLFAVLGLLSLTLTTAAQAAFIDVEGSTYIDAILHVKDAGIVEGYADGSFKPNQTINRAEFTKIIIGSLLDVELQTGANCFSDVQASDWFASFVCTAKAKGIISGYPDGSFKPADTVNYAEAAKIIAEANGLEVAATSVWYQGYLDALAQHNSALVSLGADAQLSRGQMAQLIFNLDSAIRMDHDDTSMNDEEGMDQMVDEEEKSDDTEVQASSNTYIEFSEDLIGNGQSTLLFFNASWCPACRADDSLLTTLSNTSEFTMNVASVDYDAYTELRTQYGVTSQHTYVQIDGKGEVVEKWMGPSKAEVTALVTAQ